MTLLVTGGAGFIGSNFILEWLTRHEEPVVNLDILGYAGNLENLATVRHDPRHIFVQGDIRDRATVARLLADYQPRAIVHFAAQTHVDRSIDDPGAFLQANVDGTFTLLESCRQYWRRLPAAQCDAFRFLHISTDEVYGSLPPSAAPATENHPYQPSSPYSASKAASDHLVMSWHRTYGLPTLISHCSNNYGPRQFPEKLIPLFLRLALAGAPLPLYGNGLQQRDWLHVADHCAALRLLLAQGQPGQRYNIGSGQESSNLDMAQTLCALLDQRLPRPDSQPYARLIQHVADRPGHDTRYALDTKKIRTQLGWQARTPLAHGLASTVDWYLAHRQWMERVPEMGAIAWHQNNNSPADSGPARP
ncbi:dTDP-glucose 4,6-dehydratase [Kerstersia gyiorum]|uniref:dTDP-glucose 4,6-dehydratase n=1 Tax=Kerstersia gyiorum TaxID=206506 RepID=UPI00209FEF7A|nr:dTDP-glucose 4,6-dehydratase [Kerstersia gyiorum]MCP1636937.1 dTDP-glucose 4,6-dehydratase [Kerstersia gyiorum]